jgi:hypothetical protein
MIVRGDGVVLRDDVVEVAAPPLAQDGPGQCLVAEQWAPEGDAKDRKGRAPCQASCRTTPCTTFAGSCHPGRAAAQVLAATTSWLLRWLLSTAAPVGDVRQMR